MCPDLTGRLQSSGPLRRTHMHTHQAHPLCFRIRPTPHCERPLRLDPYPSLQALRRGLLGPGARVVVSQCPRINDRFPVMAEAGVVKILTMGEDGCTPCDPLVVTDCGKLRCSSRHVFGSRDAVHDCSDLV